MWGFITSQVSSILENHDNHYFTYLRMSDTDVFMSVFRMGIYLWSAEFNLPYLYFRKNSTLIETHGDFCRVKWSELRPRSRSDCSYYQFTFYLKIDRWIVL